MERITRGRPWWQYIRIRLLVQETLVRCLVQEDPTGLGATKPMRQDCWAHVPGARALRPEKPGQRGACAPRRRMDARRHSWRKPEQQRRRETRNRRTTLKDSPQNNLWFSKPSWRPDLLWRPFPFPSPPHLLFSSFSSPWPLPQETGRLYMEIFWNHIVREQTNMTDIKLFYHINRQVGLTHINGITWWSTIQFYTVEKQLKVSKGILKVSEKKDAKKRF